MNFFKKKFWRKLGIFNIEYISYSVSLQLDIMQNYWKNLQKAHKYFLKKMPFEKFEIFLFYILKLFKIINWAELGLAIWARPKQVHPDLVGWAN
jgi:hypothetical protein